MFFIISEITFDPRSIEALPALMCVVIATIPIQGTKTTIISSGLSVFCSLSTEQSGCGKQTEESPKLSLVNGFASN